MLAALGSVAAGGAAAIGTGAFTSVVAERTLAVRVAGDATAFLAIQPEDTPNGQEYAETGPNGQLFIDLRETSTGGTGVNRNADSKFANLFRVCNLGTQIVRVGADETRSSSLIAQEDIGVFAEGPQNDGSLLPKDAVLPDNHDPGQNPNNAWDIDGDGTPEYTVAGAGGGFNYPDDPVHLEPGECVENIGIAWDRGGVDFDELDGTHELVITAEVLDDGQPGERT